jgi:hypothetical protein
MSSKVTDLLALTLGLLLLSCGASTNPIGLLIVPIDKDAFDVNLAAAQAYYDEGNFTKAEHHAEIAYGLDPISERASVLLGYVYLGIIGVGPFQLVSEMQSSSSSDSAALLEGGAGAGDTLKKLSKIVGLSPADLLLMGSLDKTVPKLPILVPNCADDARDAVEKLGLVRKAIEAACPFVALETRNPGDTRHSCSVAKVQPQSPAKAHFLWALAHLTEALAFHSVLTYSTISGSSKSNLELRFDRLKEIQAEGPEQIAGLLLEVSSLESTVTKLMPVSGTCAPQRPQTQLVALLNDVISVSAAFAAMPGIPPKMAESITGAVDKIRKAESKISEGSDAASRAKALKADFTKNIGATLSAKINELSGSGQELDDSQKNQLCGAYGSISGGQAEDANKPSVCE